MPFTKNDKNINTKGRAQGVPNTKTRELKFLVNCLFSLNLEEIIEYEESLNISQRLSLLKTLIPYVLATMKEEETMEEGIERIRKEIRDYKEQQNTIVKNLLKEKLRLSLDNKNEPILSLMEYLALSSKDRKAHRQYCRKHNIKIPI